MDLTVELSQQSFYENIPTPIADEMIKSNSLILKPDEIRRRLKSVVGACIWLYQARFDIIYEVSRLASSIPEAMEGVTQLRAFVRSAGETQ